MIINIMKRNVDKFFSFLILINVLVFSIYLMYKKSITKNFSLSYWEYVLLGITDHYYILYFMIISFIFFLFRIFDKNEEIVLIRSKRFIRYFFTQIASLSIISFFFVSIHIIIALIMGIGLPIENVFTSISTNEYFVLYYLLPYVSNPIFGIILVSSYMILGLIFLGLIFLALKIFFKKNMVIISMSVIYILMLSSLKTDLDLIFPFIFLNNYIVFHHGTVVLSNKIYLLIIIEIILSVIIIFITNKFWNRDMKICSINLYDKWINKLLFSKKNLFIVFMLISTIYLISVWKYNIDTYKDFLFLQFSGYSPEYFSIFEFLRFIIYIGVPIYILCVFLEKESTDRSSIITIRLTYKKKWLNSILKTSILFITVYAVFTVTYTFLIGFFNGYSINEFSHLKDFVSIKFSLINLVLIIMVLKILEITLCYFLTLLVFFYTKSVTKGFLLLGAFYLFSIINIPIIKFFPFGMSSLIRMEEVIGTNGQSAIPIIIMFIANVGLYLWILFSYKKTFN